ncbi:MAG: M20 family peptidase [Pikeienuella sp.]
MLKKIALGFGAVIVGLIAVIVVNTIRYVPQDLTAPVVELAEIDALPVAEKLATAITYKTISHHDVTENETPVFRDFLTWLQTTYPGAHATMEREVIAGFTPLYVWRGSGANAKPILLTAHYDVVPVLSPEKWSQPPFAGKIANGFVWGRGALDDKAALIAMMEAVERLAAAGLRPTRDIYFSFGHDEEVGGTGAAAVVKHLKAKGVQLAWTLDEGSMVLDGVVPGLEPLLASINVAEKGYVTLDLTARAPGGHSSLPPRDTAVGRLAKAISKLQDNPVPGGLTGISADFFDQIGRSFPLVRRAVFANQWLMRPIVEAQLAKSPATDAMLRTTQAPTMLIGSPQENVLPQMAIAAINYRLHPRDTIDGLIAHVRKVIDDPDIEITTRGGFRREASDVSDHKAPGFNALALTFRDVFGELVVVPGLTIAGTDTHHYAKIADNSYRINPFVFRSEDIPRLHGVDERISVDAMGKAVQFYIQLIKNAG